MMEESYDYPQNGQQKLKLIQYYALFDPNCEQGLIQGLRYYPNNHSTVIPNNPKLKTSINYYKPYTNPKVVLPKPRYLKKTNSVKKSNLNTLNQNENNYNYNNGGINYNNGGVNYNNGEVNYNNGEIGENEIYRTYRRSYSNEKDYS